MTSPQGGREGSTKTVIWGDFQGFAGVTRGGRVVEKLDFWGDVIYGWSLITILISIRWVCPFLSLRMQSQ